MYQGYQQQRRPFNRHKQPATPLRRPDEMTERGTVKFYDIGRKFGFIARSGQPDVFLHSSVVSRYGLHESDLIPDLAVRFLTRHTADRSSPEVTAIAIG